MSPNPYDTPELYDALLISCAPGNGRTPGRLKWVTLPEPDEGWEVKKGKGAAGGEMVCNGRKPGTKFVCELYLWRDAYSDQFALWDAYKVVFQLTTKDGPSQQALDVYHPILEDAGISSAVLASPPIMVPDPDGKGGGTVKLSFLSYQPVKKRLGTGKPKGSAAAKPSAKPDPNALLKAAIEANNITIGSLSNP